MSRKPTRLEEADRDEFLGEEVTLTDSKIYAGIRYAPGTYRVVNDDTVPVTQALVDEEKVMPLKAAESIERRRILSDRKKVRRKSERLVSADIPLPEDTPFLDELTAANLKTVADVQREGKEGLMDIDGIGERRAEQILDFVSKIEYKA